MERDKMKERYICSGACGLREDRKCELLIERIEDANYYPKCAHAAVKGYRWVRVSPESCPHD